MILDNRKIAIRKMTDSSSPGLFGSIDDPSMIVKEIPEEEKAEM